MLSTVGSPVSDGLAGIGIDTFAWSRRQAGQRTNTRMENFWEGAVGRRKRSGSSFSWKNKRAQSGFY